MGPVSLRYALAPEAVRDLEGVWAYGAETCSAKQADRDLDELTNAFERIAQAPTLFSERLEFVPPVRIYPFRSHLIVYLDADEEVVILRVLGGRQDWRAILRAID